MAKMLSIHDSAAQHVQRAGRHVRICRQMPDAEPYAAAIQPAIAALEEQMQATQAATIARYGAYDDVVLANTNLDDSVRTAYENVRQYDRVHRTRNLELIFGNNGYSRIVRASMGEEPQLALALVTKFDVLNIDELKPVATALQEKANAAAAKWTAYQNAIAAQREALAVEDLGKSALRKQYETNWLEARKAYGRTYADKLFPKAASSAYKAVKADAPAEEPPVKA